MILARWRARRANRTLIDQLHGKIVAAARREPFYGEYGVPDTFEGRFEMVTLHAGLAMRALGGLGGFGPELAQELADSVFRHFDVALREIGVSDVGVPKRIKRLAEAFYGRNKAYGEALAAGQGALLAAALARNVYGRSDIAAAPAALALARYVVQAAEALGRAPLQTFAAGDVTFPDFESNRGGEP